MSNLTVVIDALLKQARTKALEEDTNVVGYPHDRRDGRKEQRAADLLAAHALDGSIVVSTQMLVESYNAVQRAAALTREAAGLVVQTLARAHVVPADAASVLRGMALSHHHQLSHWDGLAVRAALDAGCTTLFTEDLQAGRRFDDLEVVNPFADAAQEPRAAHAAKPARQVAAKRKR